MKIAGFVKTSLVEWPGKVSSVIFVPGCNFRCPFCHNADLVDAKKTKKLTEYREKEVLADLKKRKKWIDGVVVTGGEPLLQKDLNRFLSRLKQMNFKTMIETNGSLFPVLRRVIQEKLVDYVAMDYKGPLDERYLSIAGIEKGKIKRKNDEEKLEILGNVKESIGLILSSDLPFELRTTVVPGIHDEQVLVKMARQLQRLAIHDSRFTKVRWVFQNFQPKNCLDQEFGKKKPYSQKQISRLVGLTEKYIPGAGLRD